MTRRSKQKMMTFLTVTVGLLFLVSCAKEKEYDTQYREAKLNKKSAIQVSELVKNSSGKMENKPIEYVYVPMTLSTPMNVVGAYPFFQGDEKVVHLRWAEAGLEVIEAERDERFHTTDENNYPVLTIPVTYKSFRCREDAYGDCTNVEEINNELEWNQKEFFTPSFEQLKVKELNTLDLATLGADSCIQQNGTKLLKYEISEGVIYIELEKSYKSLNNISCIWNNYVNGELSRSGFKARLSYSLVRLDKLKSKNYESINYPITEQDRFGFFTKERKVLGDDFDSQRKNNEVFMRRWNPKRKNGEIVYYLSSSYSKPENKIILDATYKAIDLMNSEMKKGKVPLKIKLVEQKDPATEVSPGDLRYSTLVLIEDPLASSIMGYGPNVSDPYTGEILQAHTNMYLGVLKSMTRQVYNKARDLINKKIIKTRSVKPLKNIIVTPNVLNNIPSTLLNMYAGEKEPTNPKPNTLAPKVGSNTPFRKGHDLHRHITHEETLSQISVEQVKAAQKEYFSKKVDLRLKNALELAKNQKNDSSHSLEERFLTQDTHKLDYFAENNAYSTEFFSVSGASKVVFPKLKGITSIWSDNKSNLKKWDELSKEEKRLVQDIILVQTYTSTLVHELGHNLGLRHNFNGSIDKENFYTHKEAKALGMPSAPPYSSIMDYNFSEHNDLVIFGKYDIAALRYGYAREIELSNGSFVKIKKDVNSLEKEIFKESKSFKEYAFCTDGNAGLSILCNRHDEGTDVLEITKHLIKKYKDGYKYRNFRDGRSSFSSYGIMSYHFGTRYYLSRIRDIIEDYEFYAGIYGKGLLEAGCGPSAVKKYPAMCKQVNLRRDAVLLAGDLFIEILKTPDHICAVAGSDEPNIITEYKKLNDVYKNKKDGLVYRTENYVVKSCYDKEVTDYFNLKNQVVVGENGKFFNGFKGNNPDYKYANDRAVRGIWNDKVLALKYLFERKTKKSTTDTSHMALVDILPIRKKLEKVIGHFVLGSPLEDVIPFKNEFDQYFTAPYAISNDYQIEPVEKVFKWFKSKIGLSAEGKTNYVELVLNQIARFGTEFGSDDSDSAYTARNYSAVIKEQGFYPEDRRVNSEVYYYDELTRKTFIGNKTTVLASKMISLINQKDFLESLTKKIIEKSVTLRTKPDAPQGLDTVDKIFFEISDEQRASLIRNLDPRIKLSLEAFIDFFKDEEIATKIHALYLKGKEHILSLNETRIEMMTKVSDDATSHEKELFIIPADALKEFLSGRVNDQLLEYYKSQLRILPAYSAHALAK